MSSLSSLVMFVLLGTAPTPSPAGLVVQLGSPRYAERELAMNSLSILGSSALPALRQARNDKDPEIRNRVAMLIDQIESEMLVQPTLVRLNFRNRPLAEVIQEIGRQADVELAGLPEGQPSWRLRRITLMDAQPVPYWEALDRLCASGRITLNPAIQKRYYADPPANPRPIAWLQDGQETVSPPTSDSGPFRVRMLSLSHHRDLALNQAVTQIVRFDAPQASSPADFPINDRFYFMIQVLAEPRLSLRQDGGLELLEAVDDLGQSLLIVGSEPQPQRQSGYFGYSGNTSAFQIQQDLKWPAQPGRVIKRLRGVVPVAVAARKPDPIVIPLAEATGQTFRTSETALIVHQVREPGPNQPGLTVDLSLRQTTLGGPVPDLINMHPGSPFNPIEFVDAQGNPLLAYTQSQSQRPQEVRMTLMLMPNGRTGPATQIHYYELARATTEAVFEFHDIPMP